MWVRCWAIAALLISLFAADATGTLTVVDNWLQAKRYAVAKSPVDSNIVIVAIDSESIAGVGEWPWSRKTHSKIVDKLVALRARQIAFDIDFSSASPVAGDEDLQRSLKAAGGSVILAGFRQNNNGELIDTVPLSMFSDSAWIASVSVTADRDGIIRRVPFSETLAGQPTPSLAAYLAQVHDTKSSEINVDFAISSSSFQVISAIDLLEDRVSPNSVAGRDVIVGATAVELRDLFVIPTGEIVPGSVLQALAAETAKLDRSISSAGHLVSGLGLLLIGLFGVLVRRRPWTTQLLLYAVALVAVELAAMLLQWMHQTSLATTSWMLALSGLAVSTTLGELDFRKFRIGSIQNRLGATRALLQGVVADSPAGIIVVDESNRVRVANLAARRILNLGETDCVGKFASDALPLALAQLFDTSFQLPMAPALEPRQGQLSLKLSNSIRILEYSLTRTVVADGGDNAASVSARCLTLQDMTERYEHVQRLSYLALHDSETGSRNRNSFIHDLDRLVAQGKRGTLVHMGIDRFKYINEDFGHEIGDQLLKAFALRAKTLLDDEQKLYRIAGDEFACILTHDSDGTDTDRLAHALLGMGGTIELGPYQVPFSLSVGVAAITADVGTADETIRRSDLALASAKAKGGNRISTFNRQLDEAATRRKKLESALVGAMERQEFHLVYQPQFDLTSGHCTGVESLLRWTNPALGAVSPSEFVPVAEQIGAMEEIGAWVIQKACTEISRISKHVPVAVNVSPRQLLRKKLAETITDALAVSGLPSNRLEIEITESVFADDTAKIVEVLQRLRRSGITIALDDFGTGYSSLSYLLHLPLDRIKIDKSFITAVPDDPKAIAVLSSIVGVAKGLSLPTIAEGVETDVQRNALIEVGCHQGQGYLFAKPMRAEELAVFLQILGMGNQERNENPNSNHQKDVDAKFPGTNPSSASPVQPVTQRQKIFA
jgi:diguanylate cyclase (GGDEF)-like protein